MLLNFLLLKVYEEIKSKCQGAAKTKKNLSWRTQSGKNSSAYGLLASVVCAESVRSKSYSRPVSQSCENFRTVNI